MWAVGMFRQQPSLIQRNRSISSSIHSPSSRYQASPLPWSPPQPKSPVESVSPSCPCLQCFCVECTLCTAYSGQKPCFSHHCIPPWPAQCSCSISWVKFSLANSIENTFPTYLGPSHRRCPGSVTQGMEGQQEEKMLIFYRVVQGEAYKWDWGLPSLTESVWLERDKENLSHSSMYNGWSATRGTSGLKHTVYLSKDASRSSTLVSGRKWRQEKAVLVWTSHARTGIQHNSEEILRWKETSCSGRE